MRFGDQRSADLLALDVSRERQTLPTPARQCDEMIFENLTPEEEPGDMGCDNSMCVRVTQLQRCP